MANKVKKQPVQGEDSAKAEIIRRFKANPGLFIGTVVVLVIVIVAFVFVPAIVPSAGAGSQIDLSFGTYDKIPISYVPGNYFAQVREELVRTQQNSAETSNNLLVDARIWRSAFEETVVHTGILQEMKRAGYTVPGELVDEEVAALSIFQENGRFSVARYRQMDNTSRMALWRQVQENIIEDRYRSDITELRRSSREEEFIATMATSLRSFDGVAFDISTYPDSEVSAYAAQNSGNFRSTHFSRISINSSEREARQILTSIREGVSTFEEAAKTQSQDLYAEKGGDMGVKLVYELSTEVPDSAQQEKLLALGKGELSDVLQIGSSWVIFRAEDTAYPADTSDPAVFEKIRSYVLGFERGRVDEWFIEEAEDLVESTALNGFDEAVYSKGLQKFSFGPLAVNYGDLAIFPRLATSQVPELENNYAATNLNFWQTAFSTPLNTPSRPLVLGDTVLVLYPKEETPVDETTIENSKLFFSSYYLPANTAQELNSFFTGNEKLDDRFWDTYQRYFIDPNW
jgi:hypothetical protein